LRFPEGIWVQGGEEHVLPDVHRRADDRVSRRRYFLYGSVSICSTTAWTIYKARNRCPDPTISGPFSEYKTRQRRKDGMNLRLPYMPHIVRLPIGDSQQNADAADNMALRVWKAPICSDFW
jgi:hypothetical protein